MRKFSSVAALLALWTCGAPVDPGVNSVAPAVSTDTVSEDPDDPAIWVHPSDPAQSLILGTNKVAAPAGALVVFGLDGKVRQTIGGIDRPNNVDVEYGLPLGGQPADIAVLTERHQHRLRVFRISPDGLQDVSSGGGLPVFDGETGEASEPMGIALYRRPEDGAVFAIVGRKSGPAVGYLWQYRLEDDGQGLVRGTKVREFGRFSGTGEIEAIAVDDELGYVYYADEGDGIHKWHANPDHPAAGGELALFGREGFVADREGIAIYSASGGTGFILCTDQIDGNSRYLVFAREGTSANPHDHSRTLGVFAGGADSTDGIEVTSAALGDRFPAGVLIAMNSAGRNFLVYDWRDIVRSVPLRMQ